MTERPEAIRVSRFVSSLGPSYQVIILMSTYLSVLIKPAKMQLLSALDKYENRILSYDITFFLN